MNPIFLIQVLKEILFLHSGDVKLDKKLKPINLAWKNETASEIFCNGHSVQVTFKPGSTLTGAHLSSEYELLQFHIHWVSSARKEHFAYDARRDLISDKARSTSSTENPAMLRFISFIGIKSMVPQKKR
jgi:hypothetical protein